MTDGGSARSGAAAIVAAAGLAAVFALAWPAHGQLPTPTAPPATSAPAPAPTPAPTAAPTTRATVPRTVVRRATTTRIPTTPPPTPPPTVAGTLPPTTAGIAPVQVSTPSDDTRPGEGKMPAWPKVLSIAGLAGSAGLLGGNWFRTRPR